MHVRQVGDEHEHRPAAWKVATSLLVAALVPALILAIAYPLSGYRDVLSVVQSLLVAFPFSFVGCFVLGLPTYLLLSRRGHVGWGMWLLTSAVLGAAFALILGHSSSFDMENLLRTAGLATIAATIFRGMLALLR